MSCKEINNLSLEDWISLNNNSDLKIVERDSSIKPISIQEELTAQPRITIAKEEIRVKLSKDSLADLKQIVLFAKLAYCNVANCNYNSTIRLTLNKDESSKIKVKFIKGFPPEKISKILTSL